MGRPTVCPPSAAAPPEVAPMRPPYPPVTTAHPCFARAAPRRSASAYRGSSGVIRAEPMTPISTRRAPSSGDELVATEPLLLVEGEDDAAQDALAVLTARVQGQGLADPGLAARLVDVPVQ